MENDELTKLRDRVSGLSNEELRKMVEVEYEDYRSEAIEYAKAEMDRRGLKYTSPPPATDEDVDEEETEDGAEEDEEYELPAPLVCMSCGSAMRLGYLFTEREATIVFADNNEQKFVEIHVCPRCGNVRILVDMETEVEE